MGRGAMVIFGKITLSSEADSIDRLVQKLDGILAAHGYPEAKKDNEEPDSDAPYAKDPKEMENVKEVKDLLKKAKPAPDSVVTLGEEAKELEEPEEELLEEELAEDGELGEDFPDDQA